jgi:hypothetical protein
MEADMAVIEHGPSVGVFHNKTIPGYIVTDDGKRWAFDRVAFMDKGGGCELRQLASDECVIAPGLIYRADAAPQ